MCCTFHINKLISHVIFNGTYTETYICASHHWKNSQLHLLEWLWIQNLQLAIIVQYSATACHFLYQTKKERKFDAPQISQWNNIQGLKENRFIRFSNRFHSRPKSWSDIRPISNSNSVQRSDDMNIMRLEAKELCLLEQLASCWHMYLSSWVHSTLHSSFQRGKFPFLDSDNTIRQAYSKSISDYIQWILSKQSTFPLSDAVNAIWKKSF